MVREFIVDCVEQHFEHEKHFKEDINCLVKLSYGPVSWFPVACVCG